MFSVQIIKLPLIPNVSFFRAAMTKYHKLGDKQHKFTVSQFYKLKSKIKEQGPPPSEIHNGISSCFFLASGDLLEITGIPYFAAV